MLMAVLLRMHRSPAAAGPQRCTRGALSADSQADAVRAAGLPLHHPGLQAVQRAHLRRVLHPRAVHTCPAARRLLPSRLQVHVRPLLSILSSALIYSPKRSSIAIALAEGMYMPPKFLGGCYPTWL